MKRSILLSVMLIGGILGVLGFTAAQFSDSDTAALDIEAGTLFISEDLDVLCTVSNVSSFQDIVCDPETGDFSVTNGGSLDGDLYLVVTLTPTSCVTNGGDDENPHCDDEANLGLEDLLVDIGFPVPFDTFLAGIGGLVGNPAANCYGPEDVAPGAPSQMGFAYSAISTGDLDNTHQGDGLVITYTFHLVEDGGDAPAACTS